MLIDNLTKSGISLEYLEGFIDGFEKGKAEGLEYFTEALKVERLIISEMEKTLNFLESRIGTYSFQGEQIYFNSQDDANTYNSYMRNIENFAEQETILITEMENRFKRIVEDLNKSLKKPN